MKVSSRSPAVERELEVLRRRAYGPDADIAADPAAVRRLAHLEGAARAMSTTADPRAVFVGDVRPDAAAEPRSDTRDQPTHARPRTPWWRRSVTWIAVAMVAASAGVAVTIAFIHNGPRPDLSLATTGESASDALTGNILWLVASYDIERDSIVNHEPFAAMSVWTARTETGNRCLFLTVNDAYELATSCMPRGFDPTIDFTLYAGMSALAGSDLPVGTALRFTARADTVDVWVRTP